MEKSKVLEELRRSVRENSANVGYYLAALRGSQELVAFDALADDLSLVRVPATCTANPRVVITTLVRKGALEQYAEVDGIPYSGSMEELSNDSQLDAEAEVQFFVRRTEAGSAFLAEIDPAARADALLSAKSDLRPDFLEVLSLCRGEGAPKAEIEAILQQSGALRCDERTGLPSLSCSYYTTSLEDVGALLWADGVWKATEAGEQVLDRWKMQASER